MALPRNSLRIYKEAWNDLEEVHTIYLITWNPKPSFYNYTPYGENNYLLQWDTMITDVLHKASRCMSEYAFVAEVSQEGKLHMHGFYVIDDNVKFHKQFLPALKKTGFIKTSQVRSLKWKTFKYHIKDLDDTWQHLSQAEEVVLTHKNHSELLSLIQRRLILNYKYNEERLEHKIFKRNVMSYLEFEDPE